MAKTIAVTDEVYKLLKNRKLPKESFSKVIKKNLQGHGRLSDIIGTKTLSKKDWEHVKKRLKKLEDISMLKVIGYFK